MSTLNVSNISDGTDTVETGYVVNGSAKAWFRGEEATAGISFNISSSTDHGTGDYSHSLTSALATLGATTTNPRRNSNGQFCCQNESRDSSSVVAVRHYNTSGSSDGRQVNVTFGDLA